MTTETPEMPVVSAEDEAKFIGDAYAEIPQMERDRITANEQVRKLIASPRSDFETITYGGVEIRFASMINKQLRHKMARAKVSLEEVDNDADMNRLLKSERTIYEILGELCIDDPWNQWQTWAVVDESATNLGGVQGIFLKIMEKVSSKAGSIKSFR